MGLESQNKLLDGEGGEEREGEVDGPSLAFTDDLAVEGDVADKVWEGDRSEVSKSIWDFNHFCYSYYVYCYYVCSPANRGFQQEGSSLAFEAH